MNMIELFVKIRLDNFIRQFDINIKDFGADILLNIRINNWKILKEKLIQHRYASNKYDLCDCFRVIKNIIWKNIMFYEIIDNQCHIYMYHNKYNDICGVFLSKSPHLSYDILLNKNNYYSDKLKDNCYILQTKIINYMMLLDILVTENMIEDLIPMFKAYIFDVILVV